MHVELIKSIDDPRINEFDNFYKPFELTAFHETFYFSNLNTNRITNNMPMTNTVGNFSGNIISMFDPFKNRSKKSIASINE
jgi:hypothetical protein